VTEIGLELGCSLAGPGNRREPVIGENAPIGKQLGFSNWPATRARRPASKGLTRNRLPDSWVQSLFPPNAGQKPRSPEARRRGRSPGPTVLHCAGGVCIYRIGIYYWVCSMALGASIGICTMSAMLIGIGFTRRKSRRLSGGLMRSSRQKMRAARNAGSFSGHRRLDDIWSSCSRFGRNDYVRSRLIP